MQYLSKLQTLYTIIKMTWQRKRVKQGQLRYVHRYYDGTQREANRAIKWCYFTLTHSQNKVTQRLTAMKFIAHLLLLALGADTDYY
jgi:hypothetical protein